MLNLERQFERIGARVRVHAPPPPTRYQRLDREGFRVDVHNDRDGEVFDLEMPKGADARVVSADPRDRHLVLLVEFNATKAKYLCGHDERHWFAAAIPEDAPVGTVEQAKRALQPLAVRAAAERLSKKHRARRHNEAFVRQGEWFFMPVPDFAPNSALVLKNEPLTRGRGKPHMAQFLYRVGGETVYVGRDDEGKAVTLSQGDFAMQPEKVRKRAWRVMRREAAVYVKGTIRHSDHATVELDGWCRVYPNTEANSLAMRQLSFID